MFIGLPARKAAILFVVQSKIRSRLSIGAHAIWGVMMQLGAVRRGLPAKIGSCDTTSTAAPRNFPEFRASATSCSFSNAPLAVFSRIAPSFILESVAALIKPVFSGVRGQ